MRLSMRLNLSLIAGVVLVSLGLTLYQAQAQRRSLRRDLERQALVLADRLERGAAPLVEARADHELQWFVNRFRDSEQLASAAVYDQQGQPLALTSGPAAAPGSAPDCVRQAIQENAPSGEYFRLGAQHLHIFAVPIRIDSGVAGAAVLFQDTNYIEAQQADLWRRALTGMVVQTLLIVSLTLMILHWSLRRPLSRLAQWLRELHTGSVPAGPDLPEEEAFRRIKREAARLATTLKAARAAAREEAQLRFAGDSLWTPERLRIFIQSKLDGRRLFAVSNREPYEHFRHNGSLECSVPASGLVTALEPILRACNGTWIAQGTGYADRETVDEHDRLPVPPDEPQYTLRRVWLTPEEEQGFYFGFANEGLWPLCHIAHTRPIFRPEDWEQYQSVNRRFAQAVLEEVAGQRDPLVLLQDYHFALLPRLIKNERPDARVAIFWHIPWPNPEAFGICPWQGELLDGLLGADLIGFHIQAHCNNFLDTVDRAMESRVDRGRFSVDRRGHITCVRPFPISVTVADGASGSLSRVSQHPERSALLREHGVEAPMLGIGVDRVDYTKGIPERFLALERLFEKYPNYQRQFTFVQIGAPSRTHIRRYQDLLQQVTAEAERINGRFQARGWKPIIFLPRHHSHEQIQPYYRAADLCLVTSLHDGMNLVAKEYVAARADQQGVLILSRFTGASHELADALVVNPYDTEELADTIRRALEMPPDERRARMTRMRAYVREHNVYRWAGSLIADLTAIRLDSLAARERWEPVAPRRRVARS